jgi:hypothetical protein
VHRSLLGNPTSFHDPYHIVPVVSSSLEQGNSPFIWIYRSSIRCA